MGGSKANLRLECATRTIPGSACSRFAPAPGNRHVLPSEWVTATAPGSILNKETSCRGARQGNRCPGQSLSDRPQEPFLRDCADLGRGGRRVRLQKAEIRSLF